MRTFRTQDLISYIILLLREINKLLQMHWLLEPIFLLLKAIVLTIWGVIKACLPRCCFKSRADFSADICLVTGAGQGLGRELALKFAESGSTMVLWDINQEKLEAVAEEIAEMGNEVFTDVVDCGNRHQVYRAANKVKEDVGDVAILVNNAGVVSGKKIWESSDKAIEKTFQVNTLAHFWTVKAFLPWMMENDYGYIVQICSICGFVPGSGLTDYCASKSAAVAFAETLRTELIAANKSGISVTCVCPSHIWNTAMFASVKPKLTWIMPSLRAVDVAERTVRAVQEKQFLVAIPRTFYLFLFLKGFLPTRVVDCILRTVGTDKLMDDFQQ